MLKKMGLMLGFLFTFGLLVGCGTANSNGSQDGQNTENLKQEAKFKPTIKTEETNNAIIVTYKVQNVSEENQKLTFSSGLLADFIVYDQNGNQIKQYSNEVFSTQAIQEMTVARNAFIEKQFEIPDLANGEYRIEVFLTAKEAQAEAVSELVVKNSSKFKASGELVGRMDPHSVEMKIEGKAAVFQLTIEAQQQADSLQDGKDVTFIYTESNNGQKTIVQFIAESE